MPSLVRFLLAHNYDYARNWLRSMMFMISRKVCLAIGDIGRGLGDIGRDFTTFTELA